MKTVTQQITINSSAEKIFAYMDDISNTGMHMTKSSMPMMGSQLRLEQLSTYPTGPKASFRWYGKVLWFIVDFTVIVTTWIEGKEKIWETVGTAKMVILSWYRMHLLLSSNITGTTVTLSLEYELPKNIFLRLLSLIAAPWYARWCVNNMLTDSKITVEKN